MKVAIFSPYATVVPHFDTELDIAQQHLDQGDLVEFISCTGQLANCDFNPTRDPARCEQCIGRREHGLELLQPTIRSSSLGDSLNQPITFGHIKTEFETLESIMSYELEGFDIGYAALSSVVSICRDPEPNLIEQKALLTKFLHSAWQTFKQTKQWLSDHQPDRVYVYNGRFAAMRAVLRACQLANVDCYLHERGCDGEHFELIKNKMLHDIPTIENIIREKWDSADETKRESVANSWFQERVDRVERSWHSFVKDQEQGKLPPGWNFNKKNITVFCSSDDEFVAIGDCWKNQLYPNQVHAIRDIADSLIDQPNIHITVRVHPNLKDVDNNRKSQMLALKASNLTIIPPEANVDTYELMRRSDAVVSFGSSVGIEAVYWGRPSILLGPCFYQNLGGTYQPNSHGETVELIRRELPCLEKSGALQFGYWLQTRGHRHKYFSASGLFDGTFKGQTLYARPKKASLSKRIKKKAKKLLRALA